VFLGAECFEELEGTILLIFAGSCISFILIGQSLRKTLRPGYIVLTQLYRELNLLVM
jgi:hypothetical protein